MPFTHIDNFAASGEQMHSRRHYTEDRALLPFSKHEAPNHHAHRGFAPRYHDAHQSVTYVEHNSLSTRRTHRGTVDGETVRRTALDAHAQWHAAAVPHVDGVEWWKVGR